MRFREWHSRERQQFGRSTKVNHIHSHTIDSFGMSGINLCQTIKIVFHKWIWLIFFLFFLQFLQPKITFTHVQCTTHIEVTLFMWYSSYFWRSIRVFDLFFLRNLDVCKRDHYVMFPLLGSLHFFYKKKWKDFSALALSLSHFSPSVSSVCCRLLLLVLALYTGSKHSLKVWNENLWLYIKLSCIWVVRASRFRVHFVSLWK